LKIAHVLNPVTAPAGSDLAVAQPLTFASLREARACAAGHAKVELLSAQFAEDRACVPEGFRPTPDLDRSVLDLGAFRVPRKLPLLGDILERAAGATDADYLVYTNVDIAVQPTFYRAVVLLLETEGYDGLTVNRRTIGDGHTRVEHLPLMQAELGRDHPGHDCFVFRREIQAKMDLGRVCLGVRWVARVMLMNLMAHCTRFERLPDKHLTFHVGDARRWDAEDFADYTEHNFREFLAARERLRPLCAAVAKFGPKPPSEPRTNARDFAIRCVQQLLPPLLFKACRAAYRSVVPRPTPEASPGEEGDADGR